MKMNSKVTLAKIKSELKKYEQAKLKMERHEIVLNNYLKSKIINDSGKCNLDSSFGDTLFKSSFEMDDIALSHLAGDGLCLMFGVYGMHINTAIKKIKEDGYIYTSKITDIDLSY